MRRIDDTAIILSTSDQPCEVAKACQTPVLGVSAVVWHGQLRD